MVQWALRVLLATLVGLCSCAAGAASFTYTENTDYGDSNLAKLEVHSREECCTACAVAPQCTASVFFGGECWLKQTTAQPTRLPGRTACTLSGTTHAAAPGVGSGAPVTPIVAAPPGVQQHGACWCSQDTDYAGGDLGSIPAHSPAECCAACSAQSWCSVAVLLGKKCYLKNSTRVLPGTKDRIACVPGNKKQNVDTLKSSVTSQGPASKPQETLFASCRAYGCSASYSGSQSCQCNSECKEHENCCFDYKAQCTKPGPKTARMADSQSCAVHGCNINYDAKHACQCNQECPDHSNCCSDYAAECIDTTVASTNSSTNMQGTTTRTMTAAQRTMTATNSSSMQPATTTQTSTTTQPATTIKISAATQPATTTKTYATTQPATTTITFTTMQPATTTDTSATTRPATTTVTSTTTQLATTGSTSGTSQPATTTMASTTTQPAMATNATTSLQRATTEGTSGTPQQDTTASPSTMTFPAAAKTSTTINVTSSPATVPTSSTSSWVPVPSPSQANSSSTLQPADNGTDLHQSTTEASSTPLVNGSDITMSIKKQHKPLSSNYDSGFAGSDMNETEGANDSSRNGTLWVMKKFQVQPIPAIVNGNARLFKVAYWGAVLVSVVAFAASAVFMRAGCRSGSAHQGPYEELGCEQAPETHGRPAAALQQHKECRELLLSP